MKNNNVEDNDTILETEKLDKKDLKKYTVKADKIENLSSEEQTKYFETIFNKIYSDKDSESIKNYASNCIDILNKNNDKVNLPYGVTVQKIDGNLIIRTAGSKKSILLFLLVFAILLFAILSSSYAAITYSRVKNLNKDIDGDGIPDVNISTNKDGIPNINIDINNDNIPDVNIDYKGNRKPVFNIDKNGDGEPDFNLVNPYYRKGDKCDINCDTNGDGKPDINIDIDGDGKPDINIDTNGDKLPDMNFDTDNDGVCDLHCDTNNDKVCDKYCIDNNPNPTPNPNPNETTSTTTTQPITTINPGNTTGPTVEYESGDLILEYKDDSTVFITDIYPDDQPYFEQYIPQKTFKVTNKSGVAIQYNLRWVVTLNDYQSENFKYKVASTNQGANLDWTTAPKTTTPIATSIIIPPYTTQEYTLDFRLKGVGGNQNYDQGRTFAGHIELYVD